MHYAKLISDLVLVVPLTTRNRELTHHVQVNAEQLKETSWAMCEQLRAFSTDRVAKVAGDVEPQQLHDILRTCHDFLASPVA